METPFGTLAAVHAAVAWQTMLHFTVSFVFVCEYAFSLLSASDRLKFVMSWSAVVDLVTAVVSFPLASRALFVALAVVKAARLRELVCDRRRHMGGVVEILVVVVLQLAVMAVGHSAFRAVPHAFAAAGFLLALYQCGRLLCARGLPYSRRYHPLRGRRHVLVCGRPTYEGLGLFSLAFFGNEPTSVVVLNAAPPSPAVKQLLRSRLYDMTWLIGSELSEGDLMRVAADSAAAAFVFADLRSGAGSHFQDAEVIARCLALRSYAPQLPLFVQCARGSSKGHLLAVGGGEITVVCSEEVAAQTATFSTMVRSLVRAHLLDHELAEQWRRTDIAANTASKKA